MKIIFLDIDGVLNGYEKDYSYEIIEGYPDAFGCTKHAISPYLVENLNYLIKHTGALVVVSSTWRLGETVESMQKILTSVGVVCNVIGLTDKDPSGIRGVEIYKYIDEYIDIEHYSATEHDHEFKKYVILDDDSDMLLWQKDNFVQTDGQKGLTKANVWQAINILNRYDS